MLLGTVGTAANDAREIVVTARDAVASDTCTSADWSAIYDASWEARYRDGDTATPQKTMTERQSSCRAYSPNLSTD